MEKKHAIQGTEILGTHINIFESYQSLFFYLQQVLQRSGPAHYITVNNVHTIMEGFKNPDYRSILNNGLLAIPDGKPLTIVGKLKGHSQMSRLFGPSVLEHFIDWGQAEGIRHFFLGSSETTLLQMRKMITLKFPDAKIVGMIAPPFLPMEQWDHNHYIKMINEAEPDFIWIGLGAPKQELWMASHFQKIDKGILFGIGAGFSYLAGTTKHAPQWMKNASLEWLYRLSQEPKRLWKRYLYTIPPFIFYTTLDLLRNNTKKLSKRSSATYQNDKNK